MKNVESINHPSKDLEVRHGGFGIAAGLEELYKKDCLHHEEQVKELYGSMPHSGYYGMGLGARPFKRGQASYAEEVSWYGNQNK